MSFKKQCSRLVYGLPAPWALLLLMALRAQVLSADTGEASPFPLFQSRYLALSAGKAFPEQESLPTFEAKRGDLYFGYQYVYDDQWMVGIRFGFTSLLDRQTKKELNLLKLSQESQRLIRLSYPIFLGLGGGLLYVEPSQGKILPPKKQHVYKRETGISVIASLLYILNPRVVLSLRIEKWRGLDSDDFAFFEPSLIFYYSLP